MWWKTYSDPYEPYLLFRKNSMGGLWTVGYLFALYALVVVLGQYALPQLAVPIALGGLYVFMTYVTGVVGMAVLAPIMSYAWFCLDWLIVYGVNPMSHVAALEGLEFAMVLVVLLVGAPQVRAYLLVLVMVEGLFYLLLSGGSYTLLRLGGPDNESALQTGHLIDKWIVGSLWAGEDRGQTTAQGQRCCLRVGLVPPVVGSLLARVNPVLGMLVTCSLCGYGGLCAARGIERVCWALVPLVRVGYLCRYRQGSA